MALTIKHLNGDASFLLTFEPLLPDQTPFRILIDPWITGKSKIFHSRISTTIHKEPACIASLGQLPEPDLVIISQNKSDHCNEETLRQLPPKNTKTIILAEPASARTIRGWRYFEKGKVRTIPKWGDPRASGGQAVVRIKVPAVSSGPCEPGEVTVAFIPQRRDISGLHSAIGITYRPPQVVKPLPPQPRRVITLTPPTTPRSHKSYTQLRPAALSQSGESKSPTRPTSPTQGALRSVRSTSSLATTMRESCYSTVSLASLDRPLSVIFSPHGLNYTSLHSYTTSHLVTEAALPLTALLHCFDAVSNPWWLGGNLLLGAPAGIEIAMRLGARAWISTHDGDKISKGIASGFLRTHKWKTEDVLGAMNSAEVMWQRQKGMTASNSTTMIPSSPTSTTTMSTMVEKVRTGTDIFKLSSGDEILLSNGPVVPIEPADRSSIPEVPILNLPRPPPKSLVPISIMDPEVPSSLPPPPPPSRPPPPEPAINTKPELDTNISKPQTSHDHEDSIEPPPPHQNTNELNSPAPIATTMPAIDTPIPSPATSVSDIAPNTSRARAHEPEKEEKEEHQLPNTNNTTPPNPTPIASSKSTAPAPPFLLPPLPTGLIPEMRWRRGIRGRGTNKTQSESDFASFEEIMMMRDY